VTALGSPRRTRWVGMVPLAGLATAVWSLALAASAAAQGAWTEAVQVPHAAHVAPGAPSALVHAAEGFDPSKPLHLVVFLHGYMACARMLLDDGPVECRPGEPLPGRGLARAHDAAGRDTLFVVPQLAFLQRTGKPGCFAKPSCFRSFLQEVLAALPATRLAGHKSLDDVAAITLVAHSAGYEAALAILEHGEIDTLVRDVVLFDALYGDELAYLAWFDAHPRARLWSVHLRGGRPARNSATLLRAARRRLGQDATAKLDDPLDEPGLGAALAGRRVVTTRVEGAHRELPTRYLSAVLRALGRAR